MRTNKDKEMPGAGILKGALAGIALGAAAVVLSKKENRKKFNKKVNDLLEMGEDRLDETTDRLQDLGQRAKKRVVREADRVSKALDNAQEKARK